MDKIRAFTHPIVGSVVSHLIIRVATIGMLETMIAAVSLDIVLFGDCCVVLCYCVEKVVCMIRS